MSHAVLNQNNRLELDDEHYPPPTCHDCGDVCDQDAKTCQACGEKICHECARVCQCCDKWVCYECREILTSKWGHYYLCMECFAEAEKAASSDA